ncbi:MFS transporter [Sporomusa sp.]|uniref:MFS transporter n=1 Tax=Sporomusa sp. TaxID=2078658 RepID=UPI002B991802|nr:MFS transporter [Sporomusa sp.]HWR06185.1 MFS transporter [Sporomusa sp.]
MQMLYYPWLVFGIVAVSVFLATFATSAVNIALPLITTSLQTDLLTAQWVLSGYLLVMVCWLPIAGRIGDMYEPRKIFSIGFGTFVIGSLLCAASYSIIMLIIARLVQAIGTATIMANSNGIIVSSFPAQERGKVLGMVSSIAALGAVAGPSIAGIFIGVFGWKSIFLFMMPIGVFGFIATRIVLPSDRKPPRENFDYIGSVLFTIMMVCLLLLICYGLQWSWEKQVVMNLIWVFTLGMFICQEHKCSAPMLDLEILKIHAFLTGNISGMLSWIVFSFNIISLPLFLQTVLTLSITNVGFMMSVCPIVMTIVAPLCGKLSDKVGAHRLTTIGLGLLAIGSYYSTSFTGETILLNIVAAQVIIGLGNGFFQAPNNSIIMSSVTAARLGIAGGINALFRFLGLAIGTTITIAIFEYYRIANITKVMPGNPEINTSFVSGYQTAMFIAGSLAIIGAILSLQKEKSKIPNLSKLFRGK